MLRAGIAKRYARAFYEVAQEKQATSKFADDLALIVRQLQDDAALQAFLVNPIVSAAEKERVVTTAFSNYVDESTLNFLRVLIHAGREAYMVPIATEFAKYLAEDQGVVDAHVESAIALTEAQVEAVSLACKAPGVVTVRCHVQVNPSLIGGLRIRIGDRVVDASVAGRLAAARRALSGRKTS